MDDLLGVMQTVSKLHIEMDAIRKVYKAHFTVTSSSDIQLNFLARPISRSWTSCSLA